ncbi:hypothetical protein [Marinifilum sp.]|uniref:hypothetical protein n=1 Tax=Marinifilum sp. TaxID=2033137 RepID=UPI003BA954F7
MDLKEVKLVQLTPIELENLILDSLEKYDRIKLVKEKEILFFTKKEAAKRLEISYNTLQKLIYKGLIKLRPDGKISEKALSDYLNL